MLQSYQKAVLVALAPYVRERGWRLSASEGVPLDWHEAEDNLLGELKRNNEDVRSLIFSNTRPTTFAESATRFLRHTTVELGSLENARAQSRQKPPLTSKLLQF